MHAIRSMSLWSVSGLAVVVACVGLGACGPTARDTLEVPPPSEDSALGVGDSFDVRVFGEADLTGTYRVGGDGSITFPLAGVIHVEGLETQAAAKKIAERLSDGILRNPQVSVLMKEQTSKKVVIMGQISKPGAYPYTPGMTIIDAVTVAGGFTAISAKNDTS